MKSLQQSCAVAGACVNMIKARKVAKMAVQVHNPGHACMLMWFMVCQPCTSPLTAVT